MANLYIMCGLAFSGKSTLARKIADHTGAEIVAFDKLWVEKEKEQPIPRGDEGWRFIRKIGQEKVTKLLLAGTSVVYDENNPRFEHREELRRIAKESGSQEIVVYLNTPMDLILKRQEENKVTGHRHEVEPKNFESVAKQLESPTPKENFIEFTPNDSFEVWIGRLQQNFKSIS